MGHTRLGTLPKTQPWAAVVASLTTGPGGATEGQGAGGAASGDVTRIADQTLVAAQAGLQRAKDDPALRQTVYLLTQVALAARADDWRDRLARLGIAVGPDATLADLTAEFHGVLDDWAAREHRRSDVGEIAQRAAGGALTALTAPRAETLFGNTGEDLRLGVRALSTKVGFAELSQVFFGRFMAGFLNFYLSRATAAQLGRGRIQQLGDITAFDRALATHCRESARIVRDFAGQWYSKTEYEQGISPENTGGFVAHALEKLREELGRQRAAGTGDRDAAVGGRTGPA